MPIHPELGPWSEIDYRKEAQLVNHPAISFYNPKGGEINRTQAQYDSPELSKVQFFEVEVSFDDSESREEEALTAFVVGPRGEASFQNCQLTIGIRSFSSRASFREPSIKQMVRLTPRFKQRQEPFDIIYASYYFWNLPENDTSRTGSKRELNHQVLIASTRSNETRPLDPNRSEGRGFQSPYRLTIKLDDQGRIILFPYQ